MDNIHNHNDQKRHSEFDSQFAEKLENFILNEDISNTEISNLNSLHSSDLLSHQRNFISPMLENCFSNEKRKCSLSTSNVNVIRDEPVEVSTFDDGKNKFFNEINQKIEINKMNSLINVCKHKNWNEKLPQNDDGSLLFYWYDAHEENLSKLETILVLFGKIFIKEKNSFESISIIVKNLSKKVYILPKIDKLDEANLMDKVKSEFEKLNQTKFSFIKKGTYSVKHKKYCLELPIPYKQYPVLKFSYPAKYQNIPSQVVSGVHFDHVFNKNNNLLENVFLSRKIKGPCWLKLRKFQEQDINLTWSKYEVICNDYKDLFVIEEYSLPAPPLKLLSFSTKSKKISKLNNFVKEITSISGNIYEYDLEKGSNKLEASFILMKELEPNMSDSNQPEITVCHNEIILINKFLAIFSRYDPDVLISHNLYKESLDEIISSVNILKINENWSKIGRMKRNVCPKFICGSPNLTALYQMRYFTTGRIICDTSLSLQEIIRESNYEITLLANRYDVKNNLKVDDKVNPTETNYDLDQAYQALEEARVCFELLNKFNILQLNKQLSDISGSLWVKSLQNSRTDRSEHLLLHELKRNKYILPDKSFQSFAQNPDETNEFQEIKKNLKTKNYEGGLVLEPKTGFYDQIVMILDFNSLYPSIIQQYNICFTTVERKPSQQLNDNRRSGINLSNDFNDALEEENIDVNIIRKTESKAILPQIIESLVLQRNFVKETMKKEKDLFKKDMLNIKQLALKLSANSLYGYLGYQSSRFYSKTIAALITKIGREILRETVRIVKQIPNNIENCSLDIIYGDTDSIMVNTLTNDLKQALEIGEIIKGIINDKERIIKIEIDYVFKNMLLLKKKKYAGLKYENAIELRNNNFIGEPVFKKEFKGLDMVRRDWCNLSKEVGVYIMDLLLTSQKPKEEVINLIYDYLRQINLKMNNGNIPKEKYVISKQLVKNIDQYNDVNLLPHLKVARRLREKGDLSINSGSIINYIICNLDNNKSNKKISEKAFHINELKENKNLEIDMIWYKENQLLMSVNRLLKHIKEVQMEMLVDCLELNKSRYVLKEATNIELICHEKDLIHNIFSVTLMYARNGISIQCEYCGNVMRIIKIDESNDNVREMLFCNFCKSELGNMVKLLNIISLHCKKLVSKYYYGHKACNKCQDSTRIFLKKKCNNINCNKGKYRKIYSENDIATDLSFVNKLFEFKSNLSGNDLIIKYQKDLNSIKHVIVNDINNKIEFNKIDLTSLFSFLKK